MPDNFPPARQRAALDRFAAALNSSPRALRRDECGDPRINGSRGHIYAASGGFQIYHSAGSARAWTFAKRAMVFAKATQDGGEEGVLRLDRLPTPAEASTIRDYLGIRKRIELSDEERERRRELGAMAFKNLRPPAGAVVDATLRAAP